MSQTVLVAILGVWVTGALALGWFMGRRGYEPYTWTVIGMSLGPLAAIICAVRLLQPPIGEPKFLHRGESPRPGVDVLIGFDGSPESIAAIETVERLLRERVGRITLAQVVPFDAAPETRQAAEDNLERRRRQVGPHASAVVLSGVPAEALRHYAGRLGYDLIVIGTRHDRWTYVAAGSVASELARETNIPVLLSDATMQHPRTTDLATS